MLVTIEQSFPSRDNADSASQSVQISHFESQNQLYKLFIA